MEFDKVMSTKKNIELFSIIKSKDGEYQPKAIECAKDELQKRKLSECEVKELIKQLEEKEELEVLKTEQRLDTFQKVLFFVFCWGVFSWAIAGTFKASGYRKKYSDAWTYMKYGLLFYLSLFIIAFLLAAIFIVE